jgi:hypothetical protein
MAVNRMGGYPCHPIVGHLVNIKNMTMISLYIVQSITKLQQIIRYHQKDYSAMILLKTLSLEAKQNHPYDKIVKITIPTISTGT